MRAALFSLDLPVNAHSFGQTPGREHWDGLLRGIVVIAVLSLALLASYGVAALQL